MIVLHTQEEFNDSLKLDGYKVYLFTTKWCGDCVFIKPFLPMIEKEFPQMNFFELDRDEWLELAQELDVMGIPSFITYKEDKEVSRFVSGLRKTKLEIEKYLNETLEEG